MYPDLYIKIERIGVSVCTPNKKAPGLKNQQDTTKMDIQSSLNLKQDSYEYIKCEIKR